MSAGPPGYLSPGFAQSYRPFGEIVTAPQSGLGFVKRPLPGGAFDLTGPYPYAMSANWAGLREDRAALRADGAVSVVFVADPFAADQVRAAAAGWALCRKFKTHYVVDLQRDWRRERPKEMRRVTRRALEAQAPHVADTPGRHAAALWALYQTTVDRFDLRGLARLCPETVARQLALPGALLVIAEDAAGLTGAQLNFHHGGTACMHLQFLSARAAARRTSYALIYATLEELERRGCRFANLGGAAGLDDDPDDGLAQYKRRWASTERVAHLCGEVLDPAAHAALCAAAGDPRTGFFPAYRVPGGPFDWRPSGPS